MRQCVENRKYFITVHVCEVSYESYILFFTVNVMLTATVNIIEKFGKERKANRLKIGKIGIN